MSRKPLSPTDFGRMFETFDRDAFRLETLAKYDVPFEAAALERFVNGQPLPPTRVGELASWDALIVKAVSGGKTLRRVHVLSHPLTPYLRFEIEWGYCYTATLGEQIRLLPDPDLELSKTASEDFWLFDDSLSVFLRYSPTGGYLGADTDDDPATIERCRRVRDATWARSISLSDYLARTRCV